MTYQDQHNPRETQAAPKCAHGCIRMYVPSLPFIWVSTPPPPQKKNWHGFTFHFIFLSLSLFFFFFLDRLRYLRRHEAVRKVAGLLSVPVHRARRLAVAVASNHEALPAEHPEEEVERWGRDVVVTAQLDGAVHHPLDVNQTAAHQRTIVSAKEAFCTGGSRDIRQLWRVVQVTTAEAHRSPAEERGLSAAQHG